MLLSKRRYYNIRKYKKNDFTSSYKTNILKNKAFMLFLISQGFSGLGDAFKFIALTSLIINITGSGLSAGFSLIFSIIPGIFLSLLAGFTVDLFSPKRLLIPIEFARSIIGLLLINNNNLYYVYTLIVFSSLLDALNSPPLKKTIASLLDGNSVLSGNSLLSGLNAIASIIGTTAAGIAISQWKISIVFLFNCYLHLAAGVLLIFLNVDCKNNTSIKSNKNSIASNKLFKANYNLKKLNIVEGYHYIVKTKTIKRSISANAILGFGVISVNMAFYPYAFDNLKVTEKIWGVMMSIFYGSNLIAMGLSLWLNNKCLKLKFKESIFDVTIYTSFIIISLIWFIYSCTYSLPIILIMQLIEGTLIALCSILLISKIQFIADKKILGRVTGINDFISSICKISGISIAYTISNKHSSRVVFLFNSICFFIFALTAGGTLFAMRHSKGHYSA